MSRDAETFWQSLHPDSADQSSTNKPFAGAINTRAGLWVHHFVHQKGKQTIHTVYSCAQAK